MARGEFHKKQNQFVPIEAQCAYPPYLRHMLFYCAQLKDAQCSLDEQESKHLSQVLRKKVGEVVWLTDGRGNACEAQITNISRKQVQLLKVSDLQTEAPLPCKFHLYIAPTKNQDRMEWMLEKLTETGISCIHFIQCEHSEKNRLRYDRLRAKMLSAMKQSGRYRLPEIIELQDFSTALNKVSGKNRFIAWCSGNDRSYIDSIIDSGSAEVHLFIGPEGDFSAEEVDMALQAGFKAVSLGPARLRTETAGLCGGIIAQNHFLSLDGRN